MVIGIILSKDIPILGVVRIFRGKRVRKAYWKPVFCGRESAENSPTLSA
jgi:hypothetical protein